jgi:hypothetical protein
MALLLWFRTRRMRKEAAAAMAEAFRALMEQFAALLEDFRAGKLTAPTMPEVQDTPPQRAEANPRAASPRAWRRAPARRLNSETDHCGAGREAQRSCQATNAWMIAALPPSRVDPRVNEPEDGNAETKSFEISKNRGFGGGVGAANSLRYRN